MARAGWLVVLLVATAALVTHRFEELPALPQRTREVAEVVVLALLAGGLAVRTGGRPVWAGGLAAVVGAAAAVTDWEPLVAGVAVGTAIVAAVLAVMATVPAATFRLAIREALIASAVAWVGGVAVVSFLDGGTDGAVVVDVDLFGYLTFALALVLAIALVYRLGAGLHGLGRRGYAVAGGAVLMLAIALAYSEAIAQWGSRDVVGTIEDFREWTKDTFRAVPHPIVALLGYPALVWGVFMRARRRQGWWVCAFGVAATAPAATRLVAPDLDAVTVLLGGLYSVVVGLVLGYLAIRAEQALTGTHGRRARRTEEAEALRPEPSRLRALH